MLDPGPYYLYSQQETRVRGETLAVCTRPALGRWRDWATPALLLAECAELPPQAEVLHMHCGAGLAGAAAARMATDGHVTLVDCHVTAVEAARRTLAANQVANAQALLSDCAQAVLDRVFDCVLALLPKGRAAWEQTILDAATVLRPGGDLYLAGPNTGGIKSAAGFVESVFGHVDVVAYRGGCRALHAIRGEHMSIPDSDYYRWRQLMVEVAGEQLTYVTKPGLFSWEALDAGTRLLIETLRTHPLSPEARALDVGSGSGALTLVAARQADKGSVIGVDVDCRAVEATRRTLALGALANAQATLSDCAEAVWGQTFTSIVTNPPFHREQATTYALAEQIIADACQLLEQRGQLYLVANSFLRYGPILESAFGNAQVLRQNNRYRVWYAVKGR